MSTLNVLEILNIFGLFVFAISGALRALRQDMDFFGVALLAFVTGVGGGTIRDVLLGFFPVWWIENISAVFICLAGAIVATLAQSVLDSRIKALIWADALGLSAFAILGAQSALGAGAHPVIAIFMGAVTATFGGVVRDVLLNEPPLILKQDIYATAAMLGAAAYIGLLELGLAAAAAAPLAALITFAIRGASILFNIPSPKFGHPPRQ
ncbi:MULTISPECIES: trimeric intracellular cation channel family protein [Euryhalocaulis]|uniref:trimeric intracellular cation channel family protein n=1 Tax=Euryhalocaulis TaxID=1712422 RepID=UPI0003A5F798|nr:MULTISPECIES: trimeric intracellular cation channel family protein [Euryhalocaulis]MBA4800500.1 trimeric intracellular cation channel family protein [Euryhalocaulis sp.]